MTASNGAAAHPRPTGTGPILLTGGTGTLGRLVLPLLRDAGRQVRVLSRRAHSGAGGVSYVVGDLSTGEGVEAAVRGAGTIVHCAGSSKGDEVKTRHLVRAASEADADHLVYISVVGADAIPVQSAVDRAMFGYFAGKRESEKIVSRSGLPWTTLRAAQFHDLMLTAAEGMAKLPLVPAPTGYRFQPVDAGEVAARLAELALGAPSGLLPDMAGPQILDFSEVMRGFLRATGRHRPILPLRVPGRASRAVRSGALLAGEGALLGHRTWEDFLAARLTKPLAATT